MSTIKYIKETRRFSTCLLCHYRPLSRRCLKHFHTPCMLCHMQFLLLLFLPLVISCKSCLGKFAAAVALFCCYAQASFYFLEKKSLKE